MTTPASITDHNLLKLTIAVAGDPQILRRDDQQKPAFVSVFCLRNQTPFDGARPGTRLPISLKGNNEIAEKLSTLAKGTQLTATGRLGSFTNAEKQEMFYLFATELSDIITIRKQEGTTDEAAAKSKDNEQS